MINVERTNRLSGFTLLELLVAIAVFSVLSLLAYGGLQNILHNKQNLEQSAEQIIRLQKTMLHLERDIMQFVNRPISDEFGDFDPALRGVEYTGHKLEFTRTGRPNPGLQPRSYLQRVAYVLPENEENKLYRYVWPMLDLPPSGDAMELAHRSLLLEDVEEVVIIFYDDQGEEKFSWPPLDPNAALGSQSQMIPRMIRVIIRLKSFGEVFRSFDVPQGSAS